MFRIGEFSHIARVTTRLLRHYDRLGLLVPARVDRDNGYRYYTADQLPRLNRILALKEMGFGLDEIGELVEAEVAAEQLRGMLTAKRSELRRQLDQDLLRLRLVESRIDGIAEAGPLDTVDLRVKTLEPTPWAAHRFRCAAPEHARLVAAEIEEVVTGVAQPAPLPNLLAVGHGEFTDTDVDLEVGLALEELPTRNDDLCLHDGSTLSMATLPGVDAVTGIRVGHPLLTSQFYAGVGRWLTANDAAIAGPVRELIMRPPDPTTGVDPIVEVQFPIR